MKTHGLLKTLEEKKNHLCAHWVWTDSFFLSSGDILKTKDNN